MIDAPRGKPWFAPKAFGYGAGLPIAWQGWAALAGFLAAVVAAAVVLDGWARGLVIAALIAAFVLLAYRKTDGGWRWRGRR